MLEVTQHKDISIARFENVNRFNSNISLQVKEELMPLVESENSKLVINLEDIIFIDSSAFGVLISLLRQSKNVNSHIKLCNLSKEVEDEIKVMQLDTVFDIRRTVEDCLSNF